jgi:hypothetical protein
MPQREFVERCMASRGITLEQAEGFHSKLWRLHVDSKYLEKSVDKKDLFSRLSAGKPEDAGKSFKERIRPGMVVKHKMGADGNERQEMALILSLVSGPADAAKYLCSVVSKADYKAAYELNVWHQREIKIEDMAEEVVLEYDPAMRYYFVVI